METWSHLCNSNNVFYTLPLTEECKICRLSHQVQSLRFQGYDPKPLINVTKKSEQESLRRRVAALFLPRVTPKIIDENQHDYYDRQG